MEPLRTENLDENTEDRCATNISSEFCEIHSKKTETFCWNCNVSFCSECRKLHDEHDIQDIVELLSMYSERQIDIKREIERCSSEQDDIAIRLKKMSLGVNEYVEELMRRKILLQVIMAGIMNGNMKYLMTFENENKIYFQRQLDLLSNHLEHLKRSLDMNKELKTIKDVAALLKEDKRFRVIEPTSLENGIFPSVNYLDENECESVLKFLCGTFSPSPRVSMNSTKALMRELVHLGELSSAFHLCVRQLGINVLVSDNLGNLLQVDKEKNSQTIVQTTPSQYGYFTSSLNGDIIYYIDSSAEKVIKVCTDTKRKVFLSEKKYWHLRCLTLSKSGTDIIIGMSSTKEECKLSRHEMNGKKTWEIRLQKTDDLPVSKLINICENINGDICISLLKSSVISVQNNGNIRFAYAGHESKSNFFPGGICTDDNGRIIICNSAEKSSSIHLLDDSGVFLGILLTKEQCMAIPLSVFIDKSLMYVGWFERKYLTCYHLKGFAN